MTDVLTRIFLLRHGEVAEDWRGRIYGCLDVPLSTRGEGEARASALCLSSERLGRVISSGLGRTEHTAALLREGRGLQRTDDRDLREIERGAWAGLSLADLERAEPGAWESWHRAPVDQRPPGGESLGDLRARVLPRLSFWAHFHSGERIAVVTHGWVMRVVACTALGWTLEQAPAIDVRTGSTFVIDWPVHPEEPPTWIGPDPELRPTTAPF